MPMLFKVHNITVRSSDAARLLASYLLSLSTPFEIEPMPDGKYLFGVKEEILPQVEMLLPALDRLS